MHWFVSFFRLIYFRHKDSPPTVTSLWCLMSRTFFPRSRVCHRYKRSYVCEWPRNQVFFLFFFPRQKSACVNRVSFNPLPLLRKPGFWLPLRNQVTADNRLLTCSWTHQKHRWHVMTPTIHNFINNQILRFFCWLYMFLFDLKVYNKDKLIRFFRFFINTFTHDVPLEVITACSWFY